MITCYTSNQLELKIAQIKAYELIKVRQIKNRGAGHLGAFGVIWGQNPIILKHRQIIIIQYYTVLYRALLLNFTDFLISNRFRNKGFFMFRNFRDIQF